MKKVKVISYALMPLLIIYVMISYSPLFKCVQTMSCFGYKNDYAWQLYVLESLVEDYNQCKNESIEPISCGDIIWQVQNMHVYERHFHLVK